MNHVHTPSTLSVIPLGTTFFHGSLLSHELIHAVEQTISLGKKALLFYNRRWSGRAWLCEDCSYFPLCPHCDIALAYHSYPEAHLVCHHCGHRESVVLQCPNCGWSWWHEVGIGIQRVWSDITRVFPWRDIFRLDSDAIEKKSSLLSHLHEKDIILSTYAGISLIHSAHIGLVAFLLFESDLTLPDYRAEEETYHIMEYTKKSGKSVMIQTYIPEHPLLTTLLYGNYHDYLVSVSAERKQFHYPPYTEYATIRIHSDRKPQVTDMLTKLVNKIDGLRDDTLFFWYDSDSWERSRGEWVQKIVLRGKNLSSFLRALEVEIVKNRSVTLEWR